MHDSDVFPATIESPAIFSCSLALPSSTNSTGFPRCSRNTKRSKHRGNRSLGSSSKLVQSATEHVASSSIPSSSINKTNTGNYLICIDSRNSYLNYYKSLYIK